MTDHKIVLIKIIPIRRYGMLLSFYWKTIFKYDTDHILFIKEIAIEFVWKL